MNNQLQEFARKTIKEGLVKLSEKENLMFKRMYAYYFNPNMYKKCLSPNLNKIDVSDIIDAIPEHKLDWAMSQVENSLKMKKIH